jgi:putative RecB family exonuclease
MLSLTPTKLRDYLVCPQLYKLRHIDRVEDGRNSAALSFGRSMHAALEELHKVSAGSLRDPERLLRRHWEQEGYADRHESEVYFARGTDALSRYMDTPFAKSGQILGTEVFMSYVVNIRGLRVKLGCKADRVAVDAGGVLEALDYKTNLSGRLPTPESLTEDLPTFLYYVLTRISYPEHNAVRVSLLNVLTLAKVDVEYGEAEIVANKKKLVSCAHVFAASIFDPAPSEACAWCAVQDRCPKFNTEVDLDSLL